MGGLQVTLHGRGLGWAAATLDSLASLDASSTTRQRLNAEAAAAVLEGSDTRKERAFAAATVSAAVILVGGRPCVHPRLVNTTSLTCTTTAADTSGHASQVPRSNSSKSFLCSHVCPRL